MVQLQTEQQGEGPSMHVQTQQAENSSQDILEHVQAQLGENDGQLNLDTIQLQEQTNQSQQVQTTVNPDNIDPRPSITVVQDAVVQGPTLAE